MDLEEEQKRIDNVKYSNEFLTEVNQNPVILSSEITDYGALFITVDNDGLDKKGEAIYHCRLALSKGLNIKYIK